MALDYTLFFTFANALVNMANAPSAVDAAKSTTVRSGSDSHQYIVNLTGVSNAQTISVTLNGVIDSRGFGTREISNFFLETHPTIRRFSISFVIPVSLTHAP
jgi:hypothetical protein